MCKIVREASSSQLKTMYMDKINNDYPNGYGFECGQEQIYPYPPQQHVNLAAWRCPMCLSKDKFAPSFGNLSISSLDLTNGSPTERLARQ
jgi:hypothetical protein